MPISLPLIGKWVAVFSHVSSQHTTPDLHVEQPRFFLSVSLVLQFTIRKGEGPQIVLKKLYWKEIRNKRYSEEVEMIQNNSQVAEVEETS